MHLELLVEVEAAAAEVALVRMSSPVRCALCRGTGVFSLGYSYDAQTGQLRDEPCIACGVANPPLSVWGNK